jgi:hypothetical protein
MVSEPEIWRDIKGYEGLYRVSTLGRVVAPSKKSARGYVIQERAVVGSKTKEGYLRFRLIKDGAKTITTSIHRAVATAFLSNPENKPRVNHIDNNPQNNRLSNLEWATHQEDINHKVKQSRQHKPVGSLNPRYGLKGSLNPMYGKKHRKKKSKVFEYQGITRTATEWASYVGINVSTFVGRLKMGWDFERIIATPSSDYRKRGMNKQKVNI